jgi:hypothetical protein
VRRALGLVLVVVLMAPAVAALADESQSYEDDFSEVSYSGSDGSLAWGGIPWTEIGDDGEPDEGRIYVGDGNCSNNKCLHLEGQLLSSTLSIARKADLAGFTSARLSYELDIEAGLSTLFVEVKSNGSGWQEVESYPLLASQGEHEESFDVTSHIGSDFELRFRLASVVGGLLGGGEVTIDRVQIEGPIEATTTSTSSTSTTSTTTPTTTSTTQPGATTTTPGTPTTTSGSANTSTTSRGSTTSSISPGPGTDPGGGSGPGAVGTTTTTTTPGDGSTTTVLGGSGLAARPPSSGGLRVAAVGLLADYESGMMGDMDTEEIEVLGASLEADFSMAVEAFQTAKIWIAVLALLIGAAVVSGMDVRRSKRATG